MSNDSESEASGSRAAMKTCQYCFEPIRLEAVKCRYCGSSLSEPGVTEPKGDNKVVYVLDKDLIRFAKFSVAVLTLITIVGALFYGIDVKQLRSEIEKDHKAISILTNDNKALSARLKTALEETRQVQIEIKSQAETARTNARRAEIALAGIQETQRQAQTKFNEIVALQDGSLTIIRQTTSTTSTASAPSGRGKLWTNGATLHVRFLGGKESDHAKIERWAQAWTEYANIHFVFDNDPEAEIRISFKEFDGSWSYVGRDSVEVVSESNQATMNLGWVDEANVLHQFGHVLGLRHEHQNPYEPVPWNEEAVYATFSKSPNLWDANTIDHNILRPYSKDAFPIEKPFDPHSIMLYSFSGDLTQGNIPLEAGKELSEIDKAFVAKLYPKS